ncbi:Protein of unknown function [Gryllus bimaculatus]|nr:Protein of unknown function [Gryllus bimaculatus]
MAQLGAGEEKGGQHPHSAVGISTKDVRAESTCLRRDQDWIQDYQTLSLIEFLNCTRFLGDVKRMRREDPAVEFCLLSIEIK